MTGRLLPFCRRRLDRLVLREHAERIATEAGISVFQLLTVGIPAYLFNIGLRVRLHGGEVLEFPCVFFVKLPELLLVLTPWSGAYVIDRGMIAEFELFATQRDAGEPPQVSRPIGIGPPKRKPKPRQPASVIPFRTANRANLPCDKE